MCRSRLRSSSERTRALPSQRDKTHILINYRLRCHLAVAPLLARAVSATPREIRSLEKRRRKTRGRRTKTYWWIRSNVKIKASKAQRWRRYSPNKRKSGWSKARKRSRRRRSRLRSSFSISPTLATKQCGGWERDGFRWNWVAINKKTGTSSGWTEASLPIEWPRWRITKGSTTSQACTFLRERTISDATSCECRDNSQMTINFSQRRGYFLLSTLHSAHNGILKNLRLTSWSQRTSLKDVEYS